MSKQFLHNFYVIFFRGNNFIPLEDIDFTLEYRFFNEISCIVYCPRKGRNGNPCRMYIVYAMIHHYGLYVVEETGYANNEK